MNPQETATFLRKEGFTLQDYEEQVQARRIERLKIFTEHKIEILIQNEKELIEFGEEVIRLLKIT